jgi:hypothetical protein
VINKKQVTSVDAAVQTSPSDFDSSNDHTSSPVAVGIDQHQLQALAAADPISEPTAADLDSDPVSAGFVSASELHSAEVIAAARAAGVSLPYRPRRNSEMLDLQTECDLLMRQLGARDLVVQELQADLQVRVVDEQAEIG